MREPAMAAIGRSGFIHAACLCCNTAGNGGGIMNRVKQLNTGVALILQDQIS
jgi:hypothetical protein